MAGDLVAAAPARPPAQAGSRVTSVRKGGVPAKSPGKKGRGAKKPGAGHSLGWVQGSLCGAAAAMSMATALTAVVLLAPGLLALLMDDRPSKPVARTMLLFGMAGSVAPLVELWRLGHSLDAAVGVVLHFQTVLTAWMAGGIGWLLTELAPLLVGMALSLRMVDNRKKMVEARANLAKEWGLPQADADAEDEPRAAA